jgi:hypothetical protein
MVDDLAAGKHHLVVSRGSGDIGEASSERAFAEAELDYGFNEAIREIAACCRKDGTGADGRVADAEV